METMTNLDSPKARCRGSKHRWKKAVGRFSHGSYQRPDGPQPNGARSGTISGVDDSRNADACAVKTRRQLTSPARLHAEYQPWDRASSRDRQRSGGSDRLKSHHRRKVVRSRFPAPPGERRKELVQTDSQGA